MEELIIRVKIDGMGGGGGQDSQQNRSATRNENGALAAGAIGAALLRNEGPYEGSLSPRRAGGNDYAVRYKGDSWMSKSGYEKAGLEASGYGEYGGKLTAFGTRRMIGGFGLDGITGGIQEQETLFGFGLRKTGDFYAENQQRVNGMAAALAWKTVNSAVQIQQHRSGDSYANAQLSNAMKFAGYGTALAMSGPAAPFVAAGIAVNEAFNAVTQVSNYRFDRRQESNQIRNIQIIAGDVSYGRNRGAY